MVQEVHKAFKAHKVFKVQKVNRVFKVLLVLKEIKANQVFKVLVVSKVFRGNKVLKDYRDLVVNVAIPELAVLKEIQVLLAQLAPKACKDCRVHKAILVLREMQGLKVIPARKDCKVLLGWMQKSSILRL